MHKQKIDLLVHGLFFYGLSWMLIPFLHVFLYPSFPLSWNLFIELMGIIVVIAGLMVRKKRHLAQAGLDKAIA